MRIFNQIENIVKSAKSAKSLTTNANTIDEPVKPLSIIGKELALLAEFQRLLNYVSEKLAMDQEELARWKENYIEDPATIIFCLKLMTRAISLGRKKEYWWLS